MGHNGHSWSDPDHGTASADAGTDAPTDLDVDDAPPPDEQTLALRKPAQPFKGPASSAPSSDAERHSADASGPSTNAEYGDTYHDAGLVNTIELDSGRPMSSQKLARGRQIGRYVILDRVGAGGMGVVYKAYDPELDRRIALKLLSVDVTQRGGGTEARARLFREAQALAKLSHPNVITVHDVGIVGTDVFIAMEFVEGQTLRQWLAQESRPYSDVLGVFADAGLGIVAAHGAGLIHRDFKPDNVMIGNDGRVRVLDFGLARAAGGEEPGVGAGAAAARDIDSGSSRHLNTPLTNAGTVMGTPAYMAPEQHLGHKVDARSDQFAFCVALYQALYGERPFRGKTPKAIERAVTHGEIRSPPHETRVPQWIRRIVLRGLSVNPDDRFDSMTELLAALARDPRVFRRRVAIACAGLAAIVIALVALWPASVTAEKCDRAASKLVGVWDSNVRARVRAAFLSTERSYAREMFNRVVKVLDAYRDRWIQVHKDTCLRTVSGEQSGELLDRKMYCLQRRLDEFKAHAVVISGKQTGQSLGVALQSSHELTQPEDCANVEMSAAEIPAPSDPATKSRINQVYARLDEVKALRRNGNFKLAKTKVDAVVDEARDIDYTPLLGEVLYVQATVTAKISTDYAVTEKHFMEALEAAAEARDAALEAKAWTELIYTSGYRQARHDAAYVMAAAARAALSRTTDDPTTEARLTSHLAIVLHEQGRWKEARRELRRALEIQSKDPGPNEIRLAPFLINLGTALRKRDSEEALNHFERARAIYIDAFGENHPEVSHALGNMAPLVASRGDPQRALELIERAITIRKNALGTEHSLVAFALVDKAAMLSDLDRWEDAIALLEEAAAIRLKEANGRPHPKVAVVHHNIANNLHKMGRLEEALASFRTAHGIWLKTVGEKHPHAAYTLTGLGAVLLRLGRFDEAIRYLESALRTRIAKDVGTNTTSRTRWKLAQALWESRKDRRRAVQLAKKARDSLVDSTGRDEKQRFAELSQWLEERGHL